MNNGIFQLDWTNVKSAVVYGVLSALLSIGLYAVSVGDVFALDSRALVNAGFFGGMAVLVSVVKNLLTDNEGNFGGLVNTVSK